MKVELAKRVIKTYTQPNHELDKDKGRKAGWMQQRLNFCEIYKERDLWKHSELRSEIHRGIY